MLAGSAPMKFTTTGLPILFAAASTFCATSGAGGFEISTSTVVSGSPPSATIPCSVVMPPTDLCRSWLPVPMAWEMPAPCRSMRQVTCCSPVPDAPRQPIFPRRTTLAKASGTPLMIAGAAAVRTHDQEIAVATQLFQRYFVLQCDVVAEEHHMKAEPQRLHRFGSCIFAGVEISAKFASGAAARAISMLFGGTAPGTPAAPSEAGTSCNALSA